MPAGETVVFSAHGVSPDGAPAGRGARAQDHRRDLPAGDQGPPRGEAVRRRRLRHPADRPRGPRGGRGHRRRGARAHPAGREPGRRPRHRRPRPARVAWLSQTTLSVDETLETVAAIRERFPLLLDPPSDDICYATQNRQLAVKEISRGCDLVIVVGSGNSSNSVRLVEVALEAGAKASYRVDDASEIDEAWLDGVAHRLGDLRCERAGVAGRRGARLPRRARLPGRAGRAQRRGVADLRAPQGAAPRPQGRGAAALTLPTGRAGCGAWAARWSSRAAARLLGSGSTGSAPGSAPARAPRLGSRASASSRTPRAGAVSSAAARSFGRHGLRLLAPRDLLGPLAAGLGGGSLANSRSSDRAVGRLGSGSSSSADWRPRGRGGSRSPPGTRAGAAAGRRRRRTTWRRTAPPARPPAPAPASAVDGEGGAPRR